MSFTLTRCFMYVFHSYPMFHVCLSLVPDVSCMSFIRTRCFMFVFHSYPMFHVCLSLVPDVSCMSFTRTRCFMYVFHSYPMFYVCLSLVPDVSYMSFTRTRCFMYVFHSYPMFHVCLSLLPDVSCMSFTRTRCFMYVVSLVPDVSFILTREHYLSRPVRLWLWTLRKVRIRISIIMSHRYIRMDAFHLLWIFCFRNHYSIPLSRRDGTCRPGSICADSKGWSGSIHYAESIMFRFSQDGFF